MAAAIPLEGELVRVVRTAIHFETQTEFLVREIELGHRMPIAIAYLKVGLPPMKSLPANEHIQASLGLGVGTSF